MKIATFNINGVVGRIHHLVEWLEKESPDVACLQELKALDTAFPIAEIRAAGYDAIWHGQRSWNGVAILAKGTKPIELRRGLPGDLDDVQSRYIEAAINGILVCCLYLPNGNPQPGPKFEYKLAWFERLIKHAQSLYDLDEPVILAGDFNVVPTDFDIYSPKSWKKDALLQPESRECYERLLAQGWVDSIRKLHPDEQIFTFWDYFRNHWQRNAGLRIDHLLLNPVLAPRLVDANVDRWVRSREKPSDHAPTWVQLKDETIARKPAAKTARKVAKRAKRPAKKAVRKKRT
ncbi:MAG TPA: exodeoxyribonuclease III [Steroidobacteraceae bacterium]|nr:exodeoxyribonuclease III [Steroidobacteraceae bacterium]